MWLFKPRILSLHQKIIVINTFITSRLWFMASVLSIPNAAVAKITSQIGRFIWDRYPTRVPIEQLTLPISRGGLNLHLPMYKCRSLLINRFHKDLDSTRFAKNFLGHLNNPPNVPGIPTSYPCMKYVAKHLPYVPTRLMENPSSAVLYQHFIDKIQIPRIMEEHPNVSWATVWENIRSKTLTSAERSTYYLLVNEKIPHASLLYRQNRLSSPDCQICANGLEDLEHKFSSCSNVSLLWDHLRSKLETTLNRRVSFRSMVRPELKNTNVHSRYRALKLFINYINFILDANNVMSVQSLDFFLYCASH